VLLVLPTDPESAQPLVAAARRAVQARPDSPFLVLGLVLGDAGDDVALAHRTDPEIASTLLTTFTLAWPLGATGDAAPRDASELLASAYGAEPEPCPALTADELAGVLEHLVMERAEALQAETALGLLRRGLVTHAADPAAPDLADAIERLELSLPELAELAVLRADVGGSLTLARPAQSELRRVLLETEIPARLGLAADVHLADASYAALEGAQRWRERADRLPYSMHEMAFAVARRYDRMWDDAEHSSGAP
jgi:hypothetical protein